MSNNNYIVDASNVQKTYRSNQNEVSALRGVDLQIKRGEMVAVMGPSGCGKTTLLNCLSGLDTIDGGEVLLEGESIHDMPDRKRTELRRSRMGFVFQSYNLLPVLTSVQNVELPLIIGGAPVKMTGRNKNSGKLPVEARSSAPPPTPTQHDDPQNRQIRRPRSRNRLRTHHRVQHSRTR